MIPDGARRSRTICARRAASKWASSISSCSDPFPPTCSATCSKARQGVAVLERLDQPLAVDLPLMREIRATISRCLENGRDVNKPAFPELAAFQPSDVPALYSGSFGMGSRDLQPEGIIGVVENMLPDGEHKKFFYLSIDFLRDNPISPKQRIYQETIEAAYPHVRELTIHGSENPNLQPPGQYHGPVSFGRWLGRDDDGQESGDDPV